MCKSHWFAGASTVFISKRGIDMTQIKTEDHGGQRQPSCNVSMKFNFAVGGIAIAAALLICYLAYMYW